MEPENGGPLEKEIPIGGNHHFQVPAINFWGCKQTNISHDDLTYTPGGSVRFGILKNHRLQTSVCDEKNRKVGPGLYRGLYNTAQLYRDYNKP